MRAHPHRDPGTGTDATACSAATASGETGWMADVFTRRQIEDLAGPRSFARGLAYHGQGRVELEADDGKRVTAIVRGSMPYRVELRRGPQLAWSCTCPVGEDGDFCKHCV